MAVDEHVLRGWKQTYGQIYSVEVRGVEYVFRPLTFSEYDNVKLGDPESSADAEEEIVARALLEPDRLDDRIPAGIVTSLASKVMELSGFGNPKRMKAILEDKRERANGDVRTMMKAFVLASLPAYTEEDLDNLTFDALAAKVAIAEMVMKVQQASVGVEHEIKVDIVDPDEEQAKAQEELQKHAAQKKPGTAGWNDPIAMKLYEALQ
jgi:hypothetical protein